jgi:D-sedoheptulose 7-phosphate isomerase
MAMAAPYYAFFDEVRTRLDDANDTELDTLCGLMVEARTRKAIIVGNGGSAAIAAHVATDMTKVLHIQTITFHDPALITCFANDFGFSQWVAEAIKAHADQGDLVILVSSSGKSPNIINAAHAAKSVGCKIATLSGFDPANPLRQMGDLNLYCASEVYNVVETVHQTWLLAAVEKLANG